MAITRKISQMFKNSRDEKEVERWLFSLTPLGVAFVFFFIFLLPMDLPNKNLVLVTGAAAGFAGLQVGINPGDLVGIGGYPGFYQ